MANSFREICSNAGLAHTHQRQVIYDVLCSLHGHPSPEQVYLRVKRKIPSISLATVYKNINLFVETGVFREVSPHHGTLRVEVNSRPHHHLVCTKCRSIQDIDEEDLDGLHLPTHVQGGFAVERYAIDLLGLCSSCQSKP